MGGKGPGLWMFLRRKRARTSSHLHLLFATAGGGGDGASGRRRCHGAIYVAVPSPSCPSSGRRLIIARKSDGFSCCRARPSPPCDWSTGSGPAMGRVGERGRKLRWQSSRASRGRESFPGARSTSYPAIPTQMMAFEVRTRRAAILFDILFRVNT